VDVGHRALQRDADGSRAGAENRLPAHRAPAVWKPYGKQERKLSARSRAAGKGFVVEAEADIARRKSDGRDHVLIRRHVCSFARTSPNYLDRRVRESAVWRGILRECCLRDGLS